jgi:hypothetical protein
MAAHEAAEAAAMHTERSRLLLEGASKDMQGVRRAQYQRHFGKLTAATQTNKAFKCVLTFLPLDRPTRTRHAPVPCVTDDQWPNRPFCFVLFFSQEMRGQLWLSLSCLLKAQVRTRSACMHVRLNYTHQSLYQRSTFTSSYPLVSHTGPRAQYFQKEGDLEDLRDKFATLQTIQSSTTTVSHREKLQAKIRKAEGETAKARQR